MKLRYVLLAIVLVSFTIGWLSDSQQKALEACKKAGVQSDETCEAYVK